MQASHTITRFINKESAGAFILLLMTALALFLANSAFAPLYQNLLVAPLQHFVNDGLMVLFFLLVGLEVKRELLQGELATRAQAILPFGAALGGMVLPVAIYIAITYSHPELLRGWAIPAATDIAFALGVLAMAGKRVPFSLKVFLTAFAIIDDIGAVIIIGLFYTTALNGVMLAAAALFAAVLFAMNRLKVSHIWPYLLVGIGLWLAVHNSGLHGTIAGVVTALAVPLGKADVHRRHSPLRHLEHMLHPWVIYGVIPLFALVNAGLVLHGLSLPDITAPLPLAIGAGLFLGKQLGIFLVCALLIKMRVASMPSGSTFTQLYGVAVLGGIGFTMSQFIAGLAFTDPALANAIKLGVIGGSALSALLGVVILRLSAVRH